MAFVSEEDQDKEEIVSPISQVGVVGTPSYGTGGGSPSTPSFASFRDYVLANQPQTEQLAQTLKGKGERALKEAYNLGEEQIGEYASYLSGEEEKPRETPAIIGSVLAAPEAATPQQMAEFNVVRGGGYEFPVTGFETTPWYETGREATERASTLAEKIPQSDYYEEALRGIMRNPTPGKVGLDVNLLRTGPKTKEILAPLTAKAAETRQTWQDIVNAAQGRRAETEGTIRSQVAGRVPGLIQARAGEVATPPVNRMQVAEIEAVPLINAINAWQSYAAFGTPISPENMGRLGLTNADLETMERNKEYLTETLGPKWTGQGGWFPGMSQGMENLEFATAVEPGEVARIQALYELGAGFPSNWTPEEISKAGGYHPPVLGDPTALRSLLDELQKKS